MNKSLFFVIILSFLALGGYAQKAKITISDNSAKVEVSMPVNKAIKSAVNSGIIARENSELSVVADDYNTLYTVTYDAGVYTLEEWAMGDELNETFSSTRVSDIRTTAIMWITEVNAH